MTGQRRKKGELFFYGLFFALALLVLYVLHPYLGVIAIAVVAVVVLKPLFDWFMSHRCIRGRTRIATTVTLIAFFLLIIIPVYFLGSKMISEIKELRVSIESNEVEAIFDTVLASAEEFIQGLPGFSDFEFDQDQVAETLSDIGKSFMSWLADTALNLVASLPNLFIGAIIFLIVVATLLPTLDNLDKRAQQVSPLDVNITQIYLLKSREMIVSVVKGVFLLVILQGFIMGVFYWIAGVPFTVFWMLLSMAFGVFPVVGISFIVWFLVIIFVLLGNVPSALIVLFGFYVIVNPLDLILRPKLISKEAYLNFTLMLLALFGGLAVGGLLGMIYGPVIMVLFVTTIDIYADYYSDRPSEPDVDALDSVDVDVPAPLSPEGAEETV
jgi:predicted PurR-regulated permease PerM